ncbi:MAG TPA: universal stress protein [Ohtaekwangia sp.]|uniref:universal stress protein n=1 Tax=Ohtaekwangia sp. TaxID=2066019 RepID=UPI002F95F9E9
MKKILVPCDFSKPAINAFRLALDIAQQSKGTVHLLNVIELPVMHDTLLMPVLNFEQQLLNELKEKSIGEFEKLITKYNTNQVKIERAVEFGAVSQMIMDHAENESIDMIVMGSHGASGIREFFIGSNAEKVVRNATIPVLITKGNTKASITDIVFPNTLELENQEDLVMKVKALQNFFNAKLHILWINTPLNFTSDTITMERLKTFAKRFMLKDYEVHVFNHPDEEEGIIRFTQMIKGDLIAMATHGRKGIGHLMNGSLAEDVVNHTDRLIWTYKLKREEVEA